MFSTSNPDTIQVLVAPNHLLLSYAGLTPYLCLKNTTKKPVVAADGIIMY